MVGNRWKDWILGNKEVKDLGRLKDVMITAKHNSSRIQFNFSFINSI